MAILSTGRKKSSRAFQGKFGETWILRGRLGDAGADGWGFAEKAAKLGTHFHALRCTCVPAPAFLIDPLLGRSAEGQYRHEKPKHC
jgi:hypothetical protein